MPNVVEVGHDVVRTMVRRAGVGLAGEVVRRTGGELSGVYEARLNQPDEAVIVKIYAPQWAWKQAKEIHVYGLLSAAGVESGPSVIAAEDGANPTGHAYTVMTRISGAPLSEVGAHLDPATWRHLYQQIGFLLGAIHQIPQPAYGYLVTEVLEPLPTNREYMEHQFDKKLREFSDLGGDARIAEAIERVVAERAAMLTECTGPVLCHNDLHEGNVLVARDGDSWNVHGFVDVENAIAADPLLDLAKTDYYSIHGHGAKLAGLAEGYGPALAAGEERMELYRLYHALELWVWFSLIGHHEHLPGLTDDLIRFAR